MDFDIVEHRKGVTAVSESRFQDDLSLLAHYKNRAIFENDTFHGEVFSDDFGALIFENGDLNMQILDSNSPVSQVQMCSF